MLICNFCGRIFPCAQSVKGAAHSPWIGNHQPARLEPGNALVQDDNGRWRVVTSGLPEKSGPWCETVLEAIQDYIKEVYK